jgi:hypothetical protein
MIISVQNQKGGVGKTTLGDPYLSRPDAKKNQSIESAKSFTR